ncbi:hypothetical protein CHUAL_010320 [Chamberlinius hualienensis]
MVTIDIEDVSLFKLRWTSKEIYKIKVKKYILSRFQEKQSRINNKEQQKRKRKDIGSLDILKKKCVTIAWPDLVKKKVVTTRAKAAATTQKKKKKKKEKLRYPKACQYMGCS